MGADSLLFFQEKLKPDYLKGLPDKLTLYSQFLGKRPWFAGDKVRQREGGRQEQGAWSVSSGPELSPPGFCRSPLPISSSMTSWTRTVYLLLVAWMHSQT